MQQVGKVPSQQPGFLGSSGSAVPWVELQGDIDPVMTRLSKQEVLHHLGGQPVP